jgi:hypothetical protein
VPYQHVRGRDAFSTRGMTQASSIGVESMRTMSYAFDGDDLVITDASGCNVYPRAP